MTWLDYMAEKDPAEHSVAGALRILEDVYSPQLGNRRDLYVYLPPSYHDSGERYPVLYMHDGQNLFDAPLSYVGEWQVDETMERLSAEGIEAIVVGIPNAGERRMIEYNPFDHRRLGAGQGDAYLRFLVETVKPIVDRDFRTLPQCEATGVIGSSMGGLISLYAFFRFPGTFGLCGVISPSFFIGREAIYDTVGAAPHTPGRIYLDVGTHEISSWSDDLLLHLQSRRYCQSVRRMRDLLAQKGYREGETLLYVEESGGIHHESAWARRLPDALRFLLRG